MPAPDPNEAFAWTAERGIQPEAVGVPVRQITADWNSPVVHEALLQKGIGRRAGRLHAQVQGAAAERRDAGVHLLRRITDVTWKSRWTDFVEVKDLHFADLIRQAEKHHRDRKTAHLPEDDSSGDRCALCQEYNRAPHACTSLETYTPEALICDLVSDIVSVPGSTSVSVEHSPQTSTWNHEELTRTTYTQPGSSIPNTLHNTSRLPEQ